MALAPLAITIPLVVAAVLAGAGRFVRRWFSDIAVGGAAAAAVVLCAVLMHRSDAGLIVAWLGNWRPRGGIAFGISLTIDPLGAGLGLFVAVLTAAALLCARHLLEDARRLFHVLLAVFLAALVGFALSGDLFDMFVFLELMSVCAYALAGYRAEARAPLEGALNFAVSNSVGSLITLLGIALVYARTGALNLAQIGVALQHRAPDGLVAVAFALVVTGFLVKAGAVPFHFWLADAYAVAPTPVCILFAGALSEVGLFGVARVYWTAFAGVFDPHVEALRAILVALGVLTALTGSVMALAQRHLRRMLAFATVTYVGLFLCGIGLLTPDGLAGAAIYVVGDGFAKAALFVCVAVVQHRRHSVDEARLQRSCRDLPVTGVLFALGALALVALPPFGGFLGKAMITEAAAKVHYGWLAVVVGVCSALTAGAVLRAGARIFLGWGDEAEPDRSSEADQEPEEELSDPQQRTPPELVVTAAALLGLALVLGLWPGAADFAQRAAVRFTDQAGYVRTVLDGLPAALNGPLTASGPKAKDYVFVGLTVLGALGVAGLGLAALPVERVPRAWAAGARALGRLRDVHSGRIGDYVAWVVAGTAALGAACALAVR
jgi:multicomponent Na+:H+ antiporter subunit D